MPGAQGGNNNTYCHDSHLNYLDWDACAEDASGFARFVRHLVNFRCRFVGAALVHEPTHMCGTSCCFAAIGIGLQSLARTRCFAAPSSLSSVRWSLPAGIPKFTPTLSSTSGFVADMMRLL